MNILENKIIQSHKDYPNGTDIDLYVECQICSFRAKMLNTHLRKHHVDITVEDYKKQYGNTRSKELEDRIKSGQMSPFSKGFVKYQGLDNAIDLAKEKSKEAYNNSAAIPENRSNTIEYYTSKGYSLDEAKVALYERQSTFSLAKCIEKHGEVEGRKVWQARQDKWLATLDAKSDEEKAEINKKKSPFTNQRDFINSEESGILYLIKLKDNMFKIGITSQESIKHRFNQSYHFIQEVLINHTATRHTVFMIEQVIKHEYFKYIIDKEENDIHRDFGYTEIFKDIDSQALVNRINTLITEDVKLVYDNYFENDIDLLWKVVNRT